MASVSLGSHSPVCPSAGLPQREAQEGGYHVIQSPSDLAFWGRVSPPVCMSSASLPLATEQTLWVRHTQERQADTNRVPDTLAE